MSSRSSPRNHSNHPAPPMAPPHAHISRIRVFIFPRMHLKFSRWRCPDSKLLASEQQSTNQWVTSQMLRPFLLYSLWVSFQFFYPSDRILDSNSRYIIVTMGKQWQNMMMRSLCAQCWRPHPPSTSSSRLQLS